jgi:hypothetical protein
MPRTVKGRLDEHAEEDVALLRSFRPTIDVARKSMRVLVEQTTAITPDRLSCAQ